MEAPPPLRKNLDPPLGEAIPSSQPAADCEFVYFMLTHLGNFAGTRIRLGPPQLYRERDHQGMCLSSGSTFYKRTTYHLRLASYQTCAPPLVDSSNHVFKMLQGGRTL